MKGKFLAYRGRGKYNLQVDGEYDNRTPAELVLGAIKVTV
jgi:hypothetical protein